MQPQELFTKLGGESEGGLPRLHSPALATPAGTPYLQHAGVVMIGRPHVDLSGLDGYLSGYESSLEFEDYLNDPDQLPPAAQLLKTAGQTCYASFGPKRTHNADAARYFGNLSGSGHGSVYEHASFSFLLYGISRSNTHEIVRHRAGCAYSQLSQRYVSGSVLRFVERPEYASDPGLHSRFESRIDMLAKEYDEVAEALVDRQAAGDATLGGERRTDLRKRVQQAARSVLPNEAETVMVFTANIRALRHIIEMRTDAHAEIEIRDLFMRVFLCVREVEPLLFDDYAITEQPDGTWSASTNWRKV